jgi:NAD(P)-dependent dehydrogenase (short-subunit alcohol dehydrogenase family)
VSALVTGAAGAIGSAISRRLAADGMTVVVADINGDGAQAVAAEISAAGGVAHGWTLDVSDADAVAVAVAQIAAELGPVDVLVNNAGYADPTPVLKMTPAQWHGEFGVIIDGTLNCTRAVVPAMTERGDGAVINIGSVNGMAFYSHPTYSAAKAAVFSLTQTMAALLGADGIRVNAVAPGTIRTAAWDRRLADDPEVFEELARYVPLGRVGTPEHVADAVAFLASPAASHITGVILPVDGGLTTGILPMALNISGGPR